MMDKRYISLERRLVLWLTVVLLYRGTVTYLLLELAQSGHHLGVLVAGCLGDDGGGHFYVSAGADRERF